MKKKHEIHDTGLISTTKTKNQVQGRLLLDVVVRESTTILELLTGEDETLLVGRNTLLILNFLLYVLDAVRGLDIQSDGLSSKGLYENLQDQRTKLIR